MLESYITHIRIQEDAAYPQSPAPPDSDPKNKKQRVIVISVHKTKLVRIHKGRENANGSFSIGKTWEMYELSAIENYVHSNPQTPEGRQHKLWAKDTGFLVTIVKPYYWEAHTSKEKEFFIGSMVKVYTKFTDRFDRKQGKYPILMGFAENELDTLTEHRPWAATEEGRAAHDAWMAPYTNRDDVKPPPDDPGPYVRWERARQPPNRTGPSPRPPNMSPNMPPPGDRGRMMPPEDNQANRNVSEERDTRRRPQPPGERDMRRPPPPGDRRPPPPRGSPRPPTAEGEPRQRRPGPPPMPVGGDPAIFSAGPGDGRMPPPSPRFGPPGMGTPPPGLQAGRGRRPSMEGNLRSRPSRENMALRPSASRERLQPMPGSVPPVPIPSPQRLDPQSSRSDLRPRTPDTSTNASSIPPSISPGRPITADDARSQRSQNSMERPSFDSTNQKVSSVDDQRPNANGYPPPLRRDPSPRGLRPGTAHSNASSMVSRGEDVATDDGRQKTAPPERRRPPMENRPTPLSQRSFDSQSSVPNADFQLPIQSPPPMEPPPRRRPMDIPDRPKPSPTTEVPVPAPDNMIPERLRVGPPPVQVTPLAQQTPPPTSPLPQIPKVSDQKERSPVVESPAIAQSPISENLPVMEPPKQETAKETPKEPEVAPEEKAVSPTGEIENESTPAVNTAETKMGKAGAANAFRKLATAAGAFNKPGGFVPRAGGAFAKKLQQGEKKSDEPDGISAVFVPQRHPPKEEIKEKPVEEIQPKAEGSTKERLSIQTDSLPEVKVVAPLSPTPVALKDDGPKPPERVVSPSLEVELTATKPQTEPEVRRKRRRSNQQMKNISRLGIDPNILDERGLEFEILLSEFGWGSSDLSAKNIESLESDIRREIARVEAGSWLNHLEQKDDRVEAVEKLLDRAIAECDELEGLLTLYNVELSVSRCLY